MDKSNVVPISEAVQAPDPFDPASFRIAPDTKTAVKALLLTVRVKRKPGRQDFVRVRSEPEYRQDVAVLEDEDSDDVYLVRPDVYPYIKEECRLVTIFTAISRKGDVFLWAIPLPDADGKDNDWNRTNRDAALRAMKEWVAVRSNRSIGAYVVGVAQIHIPDPEWGETPPLRDLFATAFKDRVVDGLDHPFLKKIQGRA